MSLTSNSIAQAMKQQEEWPNWPFLPIKRSNPTGHGFPECATICITRTGIEVLYVGFWDWVADLQKGADAKHEPVDAAALEAAGWRID